MVARRRMAAPDRNPPRDDRVLPATRWVSFCVVLILLPAVVVLWGLPGSTADLWAWTIMPDLTPIFMGAGYGAGAYFFTRVFLSRVWHPASVGVLSAAVFAALMLFPTFQHWDRFNHGDGPFLSAVAFYGWVSVYIVSPFLIAALWLLNRRTDPGGSVRGSAIVPPAVLLGARLFGAGALAAAAVVLVWPSVAVDNWAWSVTPLTARVLACFTAQVGVGCLMLSLDGRWSAWRLFVQTFLVAVALLLVGAVRAWDDFDTSNAFTWTYLAGLVGAGLALLLLYRAMERTSGGPAGEPAVRREERVLDGAA